MLERVMHHHELVLPLAVMNRGALEGDALPYFVVFEEWVDSAKVAKPGRLQRRKVTGRPPAPYVKNSGII
jgi:hypothetical protein